MFEELGQCELGGAPVVDWANTTSRLRVQST